MTDPIFYLAMVSRTEDDEDWKVERLTTDQNGDNDSEVERVRQAHPGEPECVIDRRVLGALAPFRCACQSCAQIDYC